MDVEKRRANQRGHAKRYHHATKQKIYDLLGRECVRCGFSDPRALQIDHIIPVKRKHKNNYGSNLMLYKQILAVRGEGFQILCANCNWIKREEDKLHDSD